MTDAYFKDIAQTIRQELAKATQSIKVAVAWFTDPELYAAVCAKAEAGVRVEIILLQDDINTASYGLDFSRLEGLRGLVYWIPHSGGYESMMHNKFCIIDNRILINGSYNWTKKAKENQENIIVTDDRSLVIEFIQQFEQIKSSVSGAVPASAQETVERVTIRLEKLRQAFKLQDVQDIGYEAGKLQQAATSCGASGADAGKRSAGAGHRQRGAAR